VSEQTWDMFENVRKPYARRLGISPAYLPDNFLEQTISDVTFLHISQSSLSPLQFQHLPHVLSGVTVLELSIRFAHVYNAAQFFCSFPLLEVLRLAGYMGSLDSAEGILDHPPLPPRLHTLCMESHPNVGSSLLWLTQVEPAPKLVTFSIKGISLSDMACMSLCLGRIGGTLQDLMLEFSSGSYLRIHAYTLPSY
jgi:hypothetical protein